MYLKCICGYSIRNVASPNEIEYLLISDKEKEYLQGFVDQEVANEGEIEMWPEHWENSGATEVWKCPKCKRLYVNVLGDLESIVVYKIEKIGLT